MTEYDPAFLTPWIFSTQISRSRNIDIDVNELIIARKARIMATLFSIGWHESSSNNKFVLRVQICSLTLNIHLREDMFYSGNPHWVTPKIRLLFRPPKFRFFWPNLDTPHSKISLHLSQSKTSAHSMELVLGCPRFAKMQDDACLLMCCFFFVWRERSTRMAFFEMRTVRISEQNSHIVGLVQNIV